MPSVKVSWIGEPVPLADTLDNEGLLHFVRTWCETAEGGRLPCRSAIDPLKLVDHGLLPKVWIVERTEDSYVYRLAGEEIVQALGQNPRGKRIENFFEPNTTRILMGRWNKLLSEQVTCHNRGLVTGPRGRTYTGERVALPLFNDTGSPSFVIGATFYETVKGHETADRDGTAIESEPTAYTPYRDVLRSFDIG